MTFDGSILDVQGKVKISTDGTYGSGYGAVGFGGLTNGYNKVFGHTSTGDGLYLAAATGRGIYFRTNGTDTNHMIVSSDGNVGIGTTSPGAKLEINAASSSPILRVAGGGDGSGGGKGNIRSSDQGGSNFWDLGRDNLTTGNFVITPPSGTPSLSITIGGNVGIGTTSPGAKLQVAGEGIFDDNANGRLTLGFATTQNDIYSTTTGFGGWKNFRISSNELILSTGGTNERMRITSSGNVGIGTTTPSGLLHLYKNNSPVVFRLQSASPYAYPGDFSIQTGGYGSNDFIIYDNTASAERLYINSSGNVGIGTTSPSTMLDISANATFNSSSTDGGFAQIFGNNSYLNLGADKGGGAVIKYNSNGNLDITPRSGFNTIFTSGNVGIGTSSPGQKLTINGNIDLQSSIFLNTNSNLIQSTPDAGLFEIKSGSSNGYTTNILMYGGYGSALDNTILFKTATSERMRITSGGNVGIGTTNPIRPLDVSADSGANAINIRTRSANDYGILSFSNSTASEIISELYIHRTGTNIGSLIFSTNNGSSPSERMRITSGGNVGIGTTSPAQKLDVAGTIRAFGAGNAGRITSVDTQVGGASIAFNPQFSTGIPGIETIGAFPMVFYTNSSEKMRISSSGNVGIGTASPNASAILHLRSTTQGFLPPVMRTGERNDISSPAVGLMIFNEEEDAVQVFTSGEGWRTLAWA